MLDRPEITTGVDALYLSPHFDDAAFSCGAQIHARARRGERVLVVTVFAGAAPPPERWSSFAASLHRLWGLDRDDPVAPRRAEERRALDVLGASGLELDLPDAIYRADAAGRPLYPTLRSLFRRERAEDRALQAALEAALRELPESPFVAAPLAIGDHVDHRMVARAARASVPAGALWLYEDYPYAERWLARRRARTGRGDWSTRVEEACEEDVLAKCDAISCYASQLGSAFGDRARLERRVRRFLARRGGERLWQASSGNAE